MKRLLTILLLGSLILVGVGTLCQSCDGMFEHRQRYMKQADADSVKFQELLVKCLPSAQKQIYQFNDVTDVIAYKLERERQHTIDSIFLTLTDQQLSNISAVLLKHKQQFSISELVTEYQSYKRVYDNLPENDEPALSNKDSPTKIVELEAIKIKPDSINCNLEEV